MKRKPVSLIQPLLFFLFAASCSQHHSITIDPLVPVKLSTTGNPQALVLKVVDSRSSNVISKWKGRLNIRGFTITPKSDITDTLHAKISEGLEKSGFNPKPIGPKEAPRLRVDLLELRSAYASRTPHLGVKIRASLKVTCLTPTTGYKNIYTETKGRKPLAPGSFPNEKLVNATLSEALRKMFLDQKLMRCLALS